MGQTLTKSIVIWTTDCCRCGIEFGIPAGFWRERRDDHRDFYCPNGHSQHFIDKSDAERERERRIAAEARAARMEDRAEMERRSAIALKGHITRLRNRIANGTCPWCKRHFVNVLRHVDAKHPEHAKLARKATA